MRSSLEALSPDGEREKKTKTDRQTDRQTDRDRQTARQAGKQTDRQIHRDRQTHRDRQIERKIGKFILSYDISSHLKVVIAHMCMTIN